MYYYDPNDRKPRLWAIAALVLYASVLAAAFVFVSFDRPSHKSFGRACTNNRRRRNRLRGARERTKRPVRPIQKHYSK